MIFFSFRKMKCPLKIQSFLSFTNFVFVFKKGNKTFFNISDNNMISVEAAKVLWYFHIKCHCTWCNDSECSLRACKVDVWLGHCSSYILQATTWDKTKLGGVLHTLDEWYTGCEATHYLWPEWTSTPSRLHHEWRMDGWMDDYIWSGYCSPPSFLMVSYGCLKFIIIYVTFFMSMYMLKKLLSK